MPSSSEAQPAPPTTRRLRVLLADEDAAALARTRAHLRALGHDVTALAIAVRDAAEAVARDDPDLSVVTVHDDPDHALDLIEQIAAFAAGPVIAAGGDPDAAWVARAAERGMFACATGEDADALQAAIEVAVRRHAEVAALAEKVEQLEGAIQRRAMIERAKGMLMERHGLDDRAAFELLRERARSRSRRVVDVARRVVDGEPLPPRGP
jgi:AmiR/NasT family two-component response regulator